MFFGLDKHEISLDESSKTRVASTVLKRIGLGYDVGLGGDHIGAVLDTGKTELKKKSDPASCRRGSFESNLISAVRARLVTCDRTLRVEPNHRMQNASSGVVRVADDETKIASLVVQSCGIIDSHVERFRSFGEVDHSPNDTVGGVVRKRPSQIRQ